MLLHDRYLARISWDEFVANRAQLQANQTSYKRGHRGAARRRRGAAAGIAICARCGAQPIALPGGARTLPRRRDRTHYSSSAGTRQLAIAVATVAEVEREDAALQKQWQLRLERAR